MSIQVRGVTAEGKDAFKNALKWIEKRCSERLNGFRKTFLVHSKVYITFGRSGKTSQPTTATHAFIPWGGDETLFRFTGRGGIVHKVPQKPARMGTWHYQAVFPLSTEVQSTQTAHIVNQWADLVLYF